ncbi:MAG: hypothetical protein C0621_04805 [Desulfuromonas sp.]|nr:MAG: hypothetical protein C0621_04805 [Desulfuromonas sp.]
MPTIDCRNQWKTCHAMGGECPCAGIGEAHMYFPSGSFTCYTQDEWANDVMKKVEDFFNIASEEEISDLLSKCGHPNPYERKPKWYRRFMFWSV